MLLASTCSAFPELLQTFFLPAAPFAVDLRFHRAQPFEVCVCPEANCYTFDDLRPRRAHCFGGNPHLQRRTRNPGCLGRLPSCKPLHAAKYSIALDTCQVF
jgi:hypothetical protein